MDRIEPNDPARNLLFGLLAFQLNFIDRRALLAAFDAWTTDKSRPRWVASWSSKGRSPTTCSP